MAEKQTIEVLRLLPEPELTKVLNSAGWFSREQIGCLFENFQQTIQAELAELNVESTWWEHLGLNLNQAVVGSFAVEVLCQLEELTEDAQS